MKTSKKVKIAKYNIDSLRNPTTPPRLTKKETKYAKRAHWGISTAKSVKKHKKPPKMNPIKPKKKKQKEEHMIGTPYHPHHPIEFP
jgi:hypothetical protein